MIFLSLTKHQKNVRIILGKAKMIIPTVQNTRTITDLREKALELLHQVNKSGPTFIFHRSKPKAVMLSIDEYAFLLEMLEDYLDSSKAKELEENPETGGLTLKEMAKKYQLSI